MNTFQIDPACFNRPCAEDEVCVPSQVDILGQLNVPGSPSSTPGCSYSCMRFSEYIGAVT